MLKTLGVPLRPMIDRPVAMPGPVVLLLRSAFCTADVEVIRLRQSRQAGAFNPNDENIGEKTSSLFGPLTVSLSPN